MVRTMRDIWDEKMREAKKQKESKIFSASRSIFGKNTEEGLATTIEYFLEHLELKEAVMDFFPDHQRYLGKGGFTKV